MNVIITTVKNKPFKFRLRTFEGLHGANYECDELSDVYDLLKQLYAGEKKVEERN